MFINTRRFGVAIGCHQGQFGQWGQELALPCANYSRVARDNEVSQGIMG
ncbi:MAG: hypothetical protein IPL78_13075 [Chloroflexi bacterium]|nr:hypothetical protein [Chloroflexota bacterium]